MPLLQATLVIMFVGMLGGMLNALMEQQSVSLPALVYSGSEWRLKPGVLANMFIGLLAAVGNWGLNAPFSNGVLIGSGQAAPVTLTLNMLLAALAVGAGGARGARIAVGKGQDGSAQEGSGQNKTSRAVAH